MTRKAGFVLVLGLFAMLPALVVACGDDAAAAPTLDRPNETAGDLANEFLALLQRRDIDGLRDYLSDAFIIQRADGTFATKDDYLTRLPEVREYTVQDVTARQAGDTLTVKWVLVADTVIEGKTYSNLPAPRLSTFIWDSAKGRWRMTSHANFNVPVTPTPTPAR